MSSFRTLNLLRGRLSPLTRHPKSSRAKRDGQTVLVGAACTSAIGIGLALSTSRANEAYPSPDSDVRITSPRLADRLFRSTTPTNCENETKFEIEIEEDNLAGHTETERFFQTLDYHRYLLPDYMRRWKGQESEKKDNTTWPRNVPTADEVEALCLDLKYCLRTPNYSSNEMTTCQNLEFRIASYYLLRTGNDPVLQQKGFKMMKNLAEHGHPDGMCMYGIILNQGKIAGVDADPQQAVVWWRRCVDFHRHITAMYELGVAYYTAEGVVEFPELAVKLFRRAAHLGHAGAAYMLGECLLDGVGVERDRGNALEWLVTAAELGHHLARDRVIVILNEDHDEMNAGHVESDEALKWVQDDEAYARTVNIEKRFTVGGGTRNPAILARRQTKVRESRDEPEPESDEPETEPEETKKDST